MDVGDVIARLEKDGNVARGWYKAYENPKPLEAAMQARLRPPDGETIPEELSAWLAYDATWLPLFANDENGQAVLAALPVKTILSRWAAQGGDALVAAWIALLPTPDIANALAIELPPSGSQEHLLILRPGREARVLGFHNSFEFWWKYDSFGSFLAHYFGYEKPE